MWKMLKDADGVAGILGMIFGGGFLVFAIVLMLNQPQVAPEFVNDQMNSNALLLGIGVVSFVFGFYKLAQYQEYQQRIKQHKQCQVELDAKREIDYAKWRVAVAEYDAQYEKECEGRPSFYSFYNPPRRPDASKYWA
jgi:hypothetical protein